MGKKRKTRASSSKSAAKDGAYDQNSRFDVNEKFEDSADEFQTGRDHILLEEGPEAKRRRKIAEDGKVHSLLEQ